ncbi:MAG: MFS transporter [Alphaproteobacteria bacterium]|nr:MFS transporter [Alphaproteobacteria bacterium]MBU1524879.1 MFS transporter [Alphaproteobacteria bacterium]MBU2118299.1 MFS transporter [Alphaproteobacteria bacterium]MBU2350138.1 MFS transporter [Alphaproteobacteria bacterium]MBU2381939.1 MFS transporter [Alphaproteobacteria bacterium]
MKSRLRWAVIGLIAVATVINYIDRNALAVMWPEIAPEIGATKEDYAALVTVFMVFYAIGQFAFGKLFDAIGVRLGFALSIGAWSVSIALHAVANSILSFSIFRALLGLSEAGAWPGAVKANAEWFPPTERAFAQGIFNAGASVGAIVSAPLIAVLFLTLGWKGTFLLIGALGFVWLLPWLIVYKAGPHSHAWSDAAQAALENSKVQPVEAPVGITPTDGAYVPTVRQLLTHRQSWGVILSRFFLDPIWWLFVSWLPLYLAETFGFDIKQIGIFAWVPFVGAAIGSLFGGWLSGVLIKSGRSIDLARKLSITLGGLVMTPCLIAAPQITDPTVAVLVIAGVLFGFQVAIGNIQTIPGDLFDGRSVGSLAGVGGMAAVAGTLITTWLVPAMTTVSYGPIFILVAALVPLSLLSIWLVLGRIAPVQPRSPIQKEV